MAYIGINPASNRIAQYFPNLGRDDPHPYPFKWGQGNTPTSESEIFRVTSKQIIIDHKYLKAQDKEAKLLYVDIIKEIIGL